MKAVVRKGAISCMRRLNVAGASLIVTVHEPYEGWDAPVQVDVRVSSFFEDPAATSLKWKREWSEEQREGRLFQDGLEAYPAVELALAALGGPCPESVELIGAPIERYDDARRVLSFALAAAATEAALTGERPRLSDEAVLDLSRRE